MARDVTRIGKRLATTEDLLPRSAYLALNCFLVRRAVMGSYPIRRRSRSGCGSILSPDQHQFGHWGAQSSKLKVFLSDAHAAIARGLRDGLDRAGFAVWQDLVAGNRWSERSKRPLTQRNMCLRCAAVAPFVLRSVAVSSCVVSVAIRN